MKVNEITIRKYRAFDQQITIPLRDLTVLTGPNNLGKSTVLNALGLLFGSTRRPLRDRFLSRTSYNFDDDYPKRYAGKPGRRWPTKISAKLALSVEDKNAATSVLNGVELPNFIEISVEFRLQETVGGLTRPHYELAGTELSESAQRDVISWVMERTRFIHIPANRNIEDFRRSLLNELVAGAVARVNQSKRRLESIGRFYEDVRQEIAQIETALTQEVRSFIPDAESIRFVLNDPNINDLVNVRDVQIDDGADTSLLQKGDGFKSLFIISMLQFIARQRYRDNLIFGIEEPEAHLHPTAIYSVKHTLRQLSRSFQTVITTHSPILIERDSLQSNIIVQRNHGETSTSSAKPARKLAEVRESLGIKPQDNMTTAEVIVVVEGATEETCLGHLLTLTNDRVGQAIREGRVRVLSANGASQVQPVVRALARDAVSCLVLLDNDEEGRQADHTIRNSGLINPQDLFTVPSRESCMETEFEDIFEPSLYIEEIAKECGLAGLTVHEFVSERIKSGGKRTRLEKWSHVMARVSNCYGKSWETIESTAKSALAQALVSNISPEDAKSYPWLRSMASNIETYLHEA